LSGDEKERHPAKKGIFSRVLQASGGRWSPTKVADTFAERLNRMGQTDEKNNATIATFEKSDLKPAPKERTEDEEKPTAKIVSMSPRCKRGCDVSSFGQREKEEYGCISRGEMTSILRGWGDSGSLHEMERDVTSSA